MNVKQLIENLSTYPTDLPVYVRDTRNGVTMDLDIYNHGGDDTLAEVTEDEEAGVLCDVKPGTKYVEGYVE